MSRVFFILSDYNYENITMANSIKQLNMHRQSEENKMKKMAWELAQLAVILLLEL